MNRAVLAKQEAARRTLLRRRLMPYIKHYRPTYKAGWVHELVCRKLEKFSDQVAQELSPRLMLLVPPRHGKSTLVSEELPSWHLGRNPLHEFISASYNISLPVKFSRRIRSRLRDGTYQALFPDAVLDPESQSVEEWLLTAGGGYLAAGVGGGITGKGAHVLGIDDPIKNAEEADSVAILESIWDWYGSTAYSRLAPGGGVLLTQTWWSEGDLAGRIQEAMRDDPEFDRFEIIKFPAIAEEDEYLTPDDTIWRESDGTDKPDDAQLLRSAGDPLHPERYTLKQLLQIKKTLMPRHWSALYQQNPQPDEGPYFAKSMFLPLNNPLPGERYMYQAWDFAITEKQASDWTVGVTGGVDCDDTLEAIDLQRFRTKDSMQIVDRMLDAYALYRPQVVGVEDGQIWKTMAAYFTKRCQERKLYPVVRPLKPITDKAARARPLQGRMAQGKVVWKMDAPWFERCQREMLRFQAGGINDDQVDAWAWLAHMIVGTSAPRRTLRKEKSWKDQLNTMLRAGGTSHMTA